MFYPVPSPEPAKIVALLPPGAEVRVAADSLLTQTPGSRTTRTLPTATVANTQVPETFVPESSRIRGATKAALLGSPISVEHPIIPVATAPGREGEKVSSNISASSLSPVPAFSFTLSVPYNTVTRLLTKERGGKVREFPIATSPSAKPKTPVQTTPFGAGGVIELTADRQQYDASRQVITAEGHVVMRFAGAVLDADRLDVNLVNRIAVAQGNVTLTRGQQLLRGSRFEYNFVQDRGTIANASGEFYEPTATTDLSPTLPNDVTKWSSQPLSDRLMANEPVEQITSPGSFGLVVGSTRNVDNQPPWKRGGTFNRLRWQADRVDFDTQSLQATDVRITNDPFSPPELELRTRSAQFQRITPLVSEVTATNPHLVLDQSFNVPLLRNRITIDRNPRSPGLITFGFDNTDRGGLFVERSFDIIATPKVNFSLTPQYFLQEAIQQGKYLSLDTLGLRGNLNATLSPRTTLQGFASMTSLDMSQFEDKARARLFLNQIVGTTIPLTLSLEYSYRDRLYNGSLGYQTVQSSFGALLTSPVFPLGKTGLYLSYQGSAQLINADTDRPDLLEPERTNNRVNLNRYQGSASLSRSFLLWQDKGLPPTAEEGLRYTGVPVVPFLQLNAGVTGVITGYSSGDTQNSISGSIGLQGQIGHFSRPYLDYTGFNVSYSETVPSGSSPFLFDRLVDNKVLSAGINQQIYGPFRLGLQTAINLDNNKQISTDYLLEYSRRTYDIVLRYNPVVQIGSISFRLNGFNWMGNPEPFPGSEVRPVIQGVPR